MPSLAELTLSARQRVDLENSNFVGAAEATQMVNASAAELYGLLCNNYEDQFLTSLPITFSAPLDGYTLPADFYRLRGVDFNSGGQWVRIHKFSFEDRNVRNRPISNLYGTDSDIQYRLAGGRILFTPVAGAYGNYQLWYIPRAPTLVSPSDNLDNQMLMNYWHEYIIVDVAKKMAEKEESMDFVKAMTANKMDLKRRIEEEATNRDAAYPETVIDVNSYSDDGWIF